MSVSVRLAKWFLVGLAIGLAAAYGSGLFASWHAAITVDRPAAELTYQAPELNASAAPYETLIVTSQGLEEPESWPLPSEPVPEAYKLFAVKLNSDNVRVRLKLSVEGALDHNLYFYITRLDVNAPALTLWGEAVKLTPENGTAETILTKQTATEYIIWIDGTVKTAETGQVKITVELKAEPVP